ncbi:hypothetical protein B5X24_HaOG213948 [Helicoverpa armigera]|uniref:Uncharacterized protein n=1 Tax=Helicoverpa armigera TaxID=29058 RepID=A0A2W1BE82_HELAM|nr:hypothetical protein B5X24_HaOG213948 [Helicoverpa armigera]
MLIKLLCVVVIVGACVGEYVGDDEYVDAVLDMLLNGVSKEFEQSDENDSGEVPVLTGGIWKCGRCDEIDETRLIYSEVNEVDADTLTDESLDIQIGLSLPDMKCVTVNSDVAGVVRRVAGACSGESVTLSVAPAQHFTVQVYS